VNKFSENEVISKAEHAYVFRTIMHLTAKNYHNLSRARQICLIFSGGGTHCSTTIPLEVVDLVVFYSSNISVSTCLVVVFCYPMLLVNKSF